MAGNSRVRGILLIIGIGFGALVLAYPEEALKSERKNVDGAPSLPSSRTFYGYECTDDCSGHEAGYAWAERKGISDPDDCGGKSQSFIEGCRAYAEGN